MIEAQQWKSRPRRRGGTKMATGIPEAHNRSADMVPKVSQEFSQPSMLEELPAILRLPKLALV
jgi:hypothetical protein